MVKQTLSVGNIITAGYLSWFMAINTNQRVKIRLYDEKRIYFDVSSESGKFCAPLLQGGDVFNGQNLKIDIETDTLIDSSVTSMDILSKDSTKQGTNFICCGKTDNSYSDVFVQISSWMSKNTSISEDEFVKDLFYQYLLLKSKYHVNYVKDIYIKSVYESYARKIVDFQQWFKQEYQAVANAEQKYKLILAALIMFESKYKDTPLSYNEWADMIFVTGKKRWSEPSVIFKSCPFQYIRGMIVNPKEKDIFNVCKKELSSVPFFDGEITLAASHSTTNAKLRMSPTQELNFRNYGIYVCAESESESESIINRSVAYAVSNKASVLIFPELSINESGLPFLIGVLNNNSGVLKLVVAGSMYEKDKTGNYRNIAYVLCKINGKWNKLSSYRKMIPFSVKYNQITADLHGIDTKSLPPDEYDMLVEDIALDSEVTVIPTKDGIIGIAICRDVMDLLDFNNPLHKYCDFVDLMLVISDNNGDSNMFPGTAECLARWHNCATLYTNSVAEVQKKPAPALPDDKLEVSFAIYPNKEHKSSTSVSGELTYISDPFNPPLTPSDESSIGILYSGTIKYTALTDGEKANCCKIYKMK